MKMRPIQFMLETHMQNILMSKLGLELLVYSISMICMSLDNPNKRRPRLSYTFWRLLTVFTLADITLTVAFRLAPPNSIGILTIMAFNCFLYFPIFSTISLCPNCGCRLFWLPLIRNSCPHCHSNLFQKS